jgi:hypothetical protein
MLDGGEENVRIVYETEQANESLVHDDDDDDIGKL